MGERERILADFLELAPIPSPSKAEGQKAKAVMEKLQGLGLEVSMDDAGASFGGEVGNIIAHLPATAPGLPCLGFNAHLDTVTPVEAIELLVDGDRIVSAGETIAGADDTCGVVVILEALRTVRAGGLAHGGLDVIFTVAEEVGLWGAKHLDWERVRARMVYVLDGGDQPGTITVAAPFANNLTFTVRGRAAHAGVCPEKGVNAIQVAARGLAAMRLGRLDDETTANVGVISGGEARNIVPERCQIQAEARSHDEAKLRAQTDHMIKALRAAAAQAQAQVDITIERCYNGFRLGPQDPVVQLAMRALQGMGIEPQLHIGGGGSDANVFNEHGLPAVILSTGAGEVHTAREYASLPVMCHAAAWLASMVRLLPQWGEADGTAPGGRG
jgi:tripeptide aminopeptidase